MINIDLAIVATPGAGMNFLGTLLDINNTYSYKIIKNNEYMVEHDYGFNSIDQQLYGQYLNKVDSNFSDNDLKIHGVSNFKNSDIILSHTPFYYFSKHVPSSINEQFCILETQESRWFINLLRLIKQEFSNDYFKDSMHKIIHVINFYKNYNSNGTLDKIPFDDFQPVSESVLSDTLIDPGSPMSWKYYFYSKLHNNSFSFRNFRMFLSQEIESVLEKYDFNDLTWYEYYLNETKSLSKYCSHVSYEDFFFKLKIPATPRTESIDKNKIKNYSLKNIELVAKCARYLTAGLRVKIEEKLAQYKNFLLEN